MKIKEQQKVILVLENGMRVEAVGMITTVTPDDDTAFELTIPNMSLNVQGGKLVESIKAPTISGMMASASLHVAKPLMHLAD